MDDSQHDVREQVDELGRLWHEFRQTNDARLAELEKRGASDPLHEAALQKMNKRIDQLATAMNRTPKGSVETKVEQTQEQLAFASYLRLGKDAMTQVEEVKALSVADDPAAGYLAPPDYANEIIKGVVEFSPMRSICRVRPTARKALQIPKRTANFSAAWVAEQGTRSETTGLTYGLEEIPTHEMYALVDLSTQLFEDSAFNLESELQQEFSEQFGVLEGNAIVTGNGSGQPEGFLDNTAVGETVSGSASTIEDADGQANGLITLYHALKTAYALRGTWVLNRTTLGALRRLKDAQENYVWMPGLASGQPNTILGAPYVEVPDMPDVASNTYPIAFGDWRRAYIIADRITLSILRDPYTQSTSGNIRFVARRRVGGQVVLAEAIRKLKVST